MRPLPDFLPGPTSRKWHGRRWWDPIGYQRVQALERPVNPAHAKSLIRILGAHRDAIWQIPAPVLASSPADRESWRTQIDVAIAAAKSYAKVERQRRESDGAFAARRDASWDQVLDALDAYLRTFQLHHLERVAAAGASGPEIDRKLQRNHESD